MSRRQRQLAELDELCRSGAVARAIDLAFAHFADFGRDDDVLIRLHDAMDHTDVPGEVCSRFAELRTSRPGTLR